MPRQKRYCPTGYPVHVIQRGINKQNCFTHDSEIAAYLHWLAEGADKYGVDVHAWVIMTNHTHLLLTPHNEHAISKLMQYLGMQYARRFNYRNTRRGSLFEDRFRSSVVQDSHYLFNCLQYIELNPVRAGMVNDPGYYRWSSYSAHAFGSDVGMWTPHRLYLGLGATKDERTSEYRRLIKISLGYDIIMDIRDCLNKGSALGSYDFQRRFEERKLDINSQ